MQLLYGEFNGNIFRFLKHILENKYHVLLDMKYVLIQQYDYVLNNEFENANEN